MYYKRLIDTHLIDWKAQPNRKPLLLRGARQVGKSAAVRELAKKFDDFVEINFEESPQLKTLLSQTSAPPALLKACLFS